MAKKASNPSPPKVPQYMFELGDSLEDRVTGLKGIAIGRCEYLNGCVQYCLKPKMLKDGKHPDGVWVDEEQLKKSGKGLKITPAKRKAPGGVSADAPVC